MSDKCKFFSFSHLGKSHEEDDLPNQDSYRFWQSDSSSAVIAVSDGAGSASLSKKGSEAIVESVVEACRRAPPSYLEHICDNIHLISILVEVAIERVRTKLAKPNFMQRLQSKPISLDEYSATLILAITNWKETAIFHVGDGYGGAARIGVDGAIHDEVVSLPVNGEYDNETYFFTDQKWRNNIRITAVDFPANFLFAMTDGADPFMISPSRDGLDRTLISQLYEPLVKTKGFDISSVFSKDKVQKVTSDDSTLVLGVR